MAAGYKQIPVTKAVLDYVLAGPRCRDCADNNGTCETTGPVLWRKDHKPNVRSRPTSSWPSPKGGMM